MDWKNTKFDWNHARAFLATAEGGSFSSAARALGLAQPTLGRQVAALEDELGVSLFERVGNTMVLTPVGLDLVEHVRSMRDAATQCALIAAGQAQSVDGLVRIAASEMISAYVLPGVIRDLRLDYPGIEVELVVSNTSSDLRRREADIAIRHVQPKGDDLIARQIKGGMKARLYATKDYLNRIGDPKTPQDLVERGQVIGFDETDTLQKALQILGLHFSPSNFPVRTENHLVQLGLAKEGAGMCVIPEVVGDQVTVLERVLPRKIQGLPFPVWLVSHRELQTNKRIRTVFDHLVAGLRFTPKKAL